MAGYTRDQIRTEGTGDMFLGVDVGTGGTRALLIDRAGKVIASSASENAASCSEHIGWAEQDPEDWCAPPARQSPVPWPPAA
jgi:glycerol kinase